ncbi:CPBP family intramembrane glutamic endopeptidase [Streptomyces gilvosporeus]|uniref:CAAX prenyl protease 2/Lysostaphin resistance protein A-like domain-containing protein n=1 Tax=Streptomyces gilvosporeus TaxID=553510 RepID=A0A1V0TW58_9ACTN|nr:CPBP family intramembrane glutamic endopeptidase [Streptomyces gilvosporeus]ARF57141.1 hypothetical protein B1H19_25880 [Streptomyces gilvosporeus]
MRLRRPADPAIILACVLTVLIVTNLAESGYLPSPGPAHVLPILLALVLLSGLVWWAGGTRDDIGLGAGTIRRGAAWALALTGIVAALYLIAALVPWTRALFPDRRTAHLDGGELAVLLGVRVPLGTVLLEEYGFRGVLYGLLRRYGGTAAATAASSLLFGLWHVLPTLRPAGRSTAFAPLPVHLPGGAVTVGTFLFTTAAGVLFCELRRRSNSLLAPMGLHWATNALGYLTAFTLSHTH